MESKPSLKDQILSRIKAEQTPMRPRAYFVAKLLALVAIVAAILVVSVFLFNFIVFSIQANHHDALLGFGAQGWLAFLQVFPWSLLALDIMLVIALQFLVRRFEFGYKFPILYLLAALLVLTIIAGVAVDATHVNEGFLRDADDGQLPAPFGDLYEGVHRGHAPGGPTHEGRITAVLPGAITVLDLDNASTTYTIPLPSDDQNQYRVGEDVFFAGSVQGDEFHAFGIRIIGTEQHEDDSDQ